MKTVKRSALSAVAVAIAFGVMAAGAQAQVWSPDNTAESGTAANPTITYGTVTITCNTATTTGMTGVNTANLSSSWAFAGNCKIGILNATFTCKGLVTLVAAGAATSFGINLDAGFDCTIAVAGVCNIDFAGAQATGNTGTINEATTVLTLTATVNATRAGAASCGPAAAAASISMSFNMTPNNLGIV
jgi:hypothetical protein